MLDNCSVLIMKNATAGRTRIAFGCVEKSRMAANCGKTVTIEGEETKVCCCDGERCNDDAFFTKCKEDKAPTQPSTQPPSQPPSQAFGCHDRSILNGNQQRPTQVKACNGKK